MPSKQEKKLSLRNNFRKVITSIPHKGKKSKQIADLLKRIYPIIDAQTLLFYYPTENEVDIKELIRESLQDKKKVFLPSSKQLIITQIKTFDVLIDNEMKFKEPPSPAIQNPKNIDVALIPGMAFSKDYFRLGHGGGWYDKFLLKVNIKYKFGVCFNDQFIQSLPNEIHDQRMDKIVTEEGVF